MASMLPQMQFANVAPGINAFRSGLADSQAASKQNLLRQVGQTAADQGLDAAGLEAMRGGDVGTGIKLQQLSLDRQAKLYDFMGRGAAAADTPEKWQAYIGMLAKTFGPDSVRGYEDFRTRESAIMLSMSAKEQAEMKLRERQTANTERNTAEERSLKERELAIRERALAGKPQIKTVKGADGSEKLVQIGPDGIATPIDVPGTGGPSPLATNIRGGLENLNAMTQKYDDVSFESAVGPFQGSTPDSLIGSATVNLARGLGEVWNVVAGGKSAPSEVRSNIQGATEALAAAVKPLIRKPGEGVWTDADQARLVSVVGDLPQARDKAEFKRRLGAVASRIEANFGVKLDFNPDTKAPAASGEKSSTWTDPTTNKTYDVRGGKLFAR